MIDYNNLNVKELRKILKKNNVKGYSSLRKADLVKLVKQKGGQMSKTNFKSAYVNAPFSPDIFYQQVRDRKCSENNFRKILGHLYEIMPKGTDVLSYINFKDENGVTPLHIASNRGYIDCVQQLINLGADVNAVTKENVTPLYLATWKGFNEIIQLLLKYHADPNIVLPDGGSVLSVACTKNNVQAVEWLMQKKRINLSQRVINNGYTPLHYAAKNGCASCINLILERNQRSSIPQNLLNARSKSGKTPLYIASENNQLACLKILLKWGANPNTSKNNGTTPLEIAQRKNYVDIKSILLRKTNKSTTTITPPPVPTGNNRWGIQPTGNNPGLYYERPQKKSLKNRASNWWESVKPKKSSQNVSEPEIPKKSIRKKFSNWWDQKKIPSKQIPQPTGEIPQKKSFKKQVSNWWDQKKFPSKQMQGPVASDYLQKKSLNDNAKKPQQESFPTYKPYQGNQTMNQFSHRQL